MSVVVSTVERKHTGEAHVWRRRGKSVEWCFLRCLLVSLFFSSEHSP